MTSRICKLKRRKFFQLFHEYVKNEILNTNPGVWVKKLPFFFLVKRKKGWVKMKSSPENLKFKFFYIYFLAQLMLYTYVTLKNKKSM
jgi:hypothetical protein